MSEAVVLRDARVESWEDHVEAWHHLCRQADNTLWRRAEIAASLERRYRAASLETFAKEVKCSAEWVRRLAHTARVFSENPTRVGNLSFSHHMLAVALTDSDDGARQAIALAESDRLSTTALRRRLSPAPEEEKADEPTDVCTEPGSCGPITDSDRVLHIWAFVENFYAVKDYDAKALIEQSTKKSAKEMLRKIDQIQKWFATMQEAIRERVG